MEQVELTRQLIERHPSFTLLQPIHARLGGLIEMLTIASSDYYHVKVSHASRATETNRYHQDISMRMLDKIFHPTLESCKNLCRKYHLLITPLQKSWMPCLKYTSLKPDLIKISKQIDQQILMVNIVRQVLEKFDNDSMRASNYKRESFDSDETKVEKDLDLSKESLGGKGSLYASHEIQFPAWMCDPTDQFEGKPYSLQGATIISKEKEQ